jgi:hypothetical protein
MEYNLKHLLFHIVTEMIKKNNFLIKIAQCALHIFKLTLCNKKFAHCKPCFQFNLNGNPVLSVLCDCEIAVIIFNSHNKLFQESSPQVCFYNFHCSPLIFLCSVILAKKICCLINHDGQKGFLSFFFYF